MKDYGVGIIGVGKYLPSNILDNEQVRELSGADPDEIVKKLGIHERRIANKNETASMMSTSAAIDALKSANISASDLGLIIDCTWTGEYRFPALACKIQANIEAWNAGAFDLLANCTSFAIGVSTAAEKMYFDQNLNYSLVIGTAKQSPFINFSDPNMAGYFGDGVGAAVLGKVPKGYGVLSNETLSNGRVYESARLRYGGSEKFDDESAKFFEMNGLEVWKQVVQFQPKIIKKSLEKIGLKIEDVDFFIFHQANSNLIAYLLGKLKIDPAKTYTTVEKYGNTADASIPITLCEAVELGKIKRDDIVVISGTGAGYIFGSTVLRWY